MSLDIICADVLEWCESYEGPKFHAILCDPSYALSKKKRLDMDAPVDAQIETVGDVIAAYHALQQWGDDGFMNRKWDNDVAFNPETWRALARHLHLGGFIMAFASSRGDHRLAVAMEDAGLVIHPKIFIWLNAQSFPKATRPFKEPKKWRKVQHRWLGWMGELGNWILRKWDCPPKYYLDFIFGGYRYGRQALKNCAEPIIMAQKPYDGRSVDCIADTGAGALNIDGGRVGFEKGGDLASNPSLRDSVAGGCGGHIIATETERRYYKPPSGRWPPNFALVHMPPTLRCTQCQAVHPIQPVIEVCPDCGGDLKRVEGCRRVGVKRVKGRKDEVPTEDEGRIDKSQWRFRPTPATSRGYADPDGRETVADFRCADGCVVARLDEQAGERGASAPVKGHEPSRTGDRGIYHHYERVPGPFHNDSGGASRFYVNADWTHEAAEQLAQADPVRYVPKAAKKERSSGLDDFYWRRDKSSPTGFVRVSQEEWEALPRRQRARGNIHPTVKPLSLLIWLAKLLLPPPEYAPRRIMIPFSGTLSEGLGAALAGWEEVVAIEMLRDYCDISEARKSFWLEQARQMEMPL